MPVRECTKEGKRGYKWGEQGFCYTYTMGDVKSERAAYEKALKQGRAVKGRK